MMMMMMTGVTICKTEGKAQSLLELMNSYVPEQ